MGIVKLLTHFVACLIEGILLTVLHGWTVGIDGNLLLFDYLARHAESVLAKDYSGVIDDFACFIDTLRLHGITPLVVFDGERFLPKTKHVGAQRAAKLAAAQTKYAGATTADERAAAAKNIVRPTKELIDALVKVLSDRGL